MNKLCHICNNNPSIYCCPRCQIRSCSLQCVNKHKEERGCSGIRDNTRFVAKQEFNETHLRSDYSFLESVQESVVTASGDRSKNFSRIDPLAKPLPPHLRRLHGACRRRGTRLLFLPQHFERHRVNSTRLNFGDNCIQWRVQLMFPHVQKEKSESKIVLDKVDEYTPLWCLLRPYLEVDNNSDNEDENDEYVMYRAAGTANVAVLLKAEGIRPAGKEYIELDMKASIKDNLRDKIVVEHPVFYIILKHHLQTFIPEPDDVDDENLEHQEPMETDEVKVAQRKTFGLLSDGETSSDEDFEPTPKKSHDFDQKEENKLKESDISKSENEERVHLTKEKAASKEQDQRVYQQCFDYYMTYYKDKYNIKQKEDNDRLGFRENNDSLKQSGLVAYDESDSE